jgi:hypothetical protein
MASLIYSWQEEFSSYGDVQFVPPGDVLLDDEAQLEDAVVMLSQEGKLQRVHTYRLLQAVSHILFTATDGRVDVDFFRTPLGVVLRPASEEEVREVREENGINRAFLVNTLTGVEIPVIDDHVNVEELRQLRRYIWCCLVPEHAQEWFVAHGSANVYVSFCSHIRLHMIWQSLSE